MGANQTKQTSVIETVNNIVNKTVNKTVNKNSAAASAIQKMELGCTEDQFKLASESYNKAEEQYTKRYKLWVENGAIPTAAPKEPEDTMCSFDNIEQSAIVKLKTDTQSKTEMKNDIKTDLKATASQYDSMEKVKDLIGYSDTEKESFVKIANNIKNETFNETLNETLNTATANQDMKLSGGKFSNVKQSAVVDMVTYSIVANITEGISDTALTSSTEQKSSLKEESGQANTAKAAIDMVGSVVNNAISMVGSVWILMILCVIAVVVFFPGAFCIIPPLRLPLMAMGLCGSKKNADKDTSADDNDNRRKSNNQRNDDDYDNRSNNRRNNRRNNDDDYDNNNRKKYNNQRNNDDDYDNDNRTKSNNRRNNDDDYDNDNRKKSNNRRNNDD